MSRGLFAKVKPAGLTSALTHYRIGHTAKAFLPGLIPDILHIKSDFSSFDYFLSDILFPKK